MSEKKYILKLLLLGDTGVGKTSIAQVYVNDTFQTSYKSTIGLDILYKKIALKSENMTNEIMFDLQIFDFSGHSYFKKMRNALMNASHGGILIFDMTRRTTFDSLTNWIEDTLLAAGKIPLVLACNKADLDSSITMKEIEEFAKNHEIPFFKKTSAKEGFGLEEIFIEMTKIVATKNKWI